MKRAAADEQANQAVAPFTGGVQGGIYAHIAHGRSYDEAQAFRANPGVERKQLKTLQTLAKKLGYQLIGNKSVTTT